MRLFIEELCIHMACTEASAKTYDTDTFCFYIQSEVLVYQILTLFLPTKMPYVQTMQLQISLGNNTN